MIEIIPNWHPIFVHFTVALLTIGALLKIGSHMVGSDALRGQLSQVAHWNLWIGAGFVLLTVLSGVIAYNTVAHDTPSHTAMMNHRNWALGTAALFLVIAGWLVTLVRADRARNGLFLTVLVVALGLLGVTAWKGGELVYRYGLGVMSLPRVDTHSHEEGEHHDHGAVTEELHNHADSPSGSHHDDLSTEDHHHDTPPASSNTPTTDSAPVSSKDDHFADGHTH